MFQLDINVESYHLAFDKKELRKALRAVGSLVARKARALIRGATESKPGQPPVSRTGLLRGSIKVAVSKDASSVAIRDTMFYAKFLELGAEGGGGRKRAGRNKRGKPMTRRVLKPRPFLSTALEQSQRIIEARIEDAIRKSLTGS